MKTAKRNQSSLPSPAKEVANIFLITVISYFSWNSLNASNPEYNTGSSLEGRFAIGLIKEPESALELKDWMLSITDDDIAEYSESEIKLESWMTNLEEFYPADSEKDLAVEGWMLTKNEWMNLKFPVKKSTDTHIQRMPSPNL